MRARTQPETLIGALVPLITSCQSGDGKYIFIGSSPIEYLPSI